MKMRRVFLITKVMLSAKEVAQMENTREAQGIGLDPRKECIWSPVKG